MKVLFVRFSSLGDVILTTGIIRKFKQLFPEAQADVLTYSQFYDVFAGLPFVDKVICYGRGSGLVQYMSLVQREINEYDHIFDLHGKPLSFFLRFLSQADYHKYRKDSSARRRYVKDHKTTVRLEMHVTQKYFEPLAQTFGLDMPKPEELRPQLVSDKQPVKGHVLMHPFASRYTKTYPFMRELSELLISEGFTPVFAGDGEAPQIDGAVYKTGKTSLKDLFDTVASCEAVISTDSGPMHIGVALNRPTVAVFGSTTRQFGFFPIFENVRIIEDNSVTCRPCDVHGLPACPQEHFSCMKNISAESIVSGLKDLIRR